MRRLHLSFVLFATLGIGALFSGCATTGSVADENAPPPPIVHDMSLEAALDAGIQHGGDTLARVKRLISRRKEWRPATTILASRVVAGMSRMEDRQLINAMNLYQGSPESASVDLFNKLVGSARPLARQLGWQMAATMPSRSIGQAVEKELSRALIEGDETDTLVPEMALAVRANRLTKSYTMLRQGLLRTGHEAFAAAMAELDPAAASNDFMDYLALAPVEELRQLTLNSVNLYSCMIALKHLLGRPVSVSHPQVEHLYYYSVSRNPALAELAMQVIEQYPASDRATLAWTLARMPVWLQLSYIENVRRKTTASTGLFLAELRRITSQPEVVEEIDDVRQ